MKKKKTTQSRIENQPHYTKVGRLRKSIATQIKRKAADIYIDDNHLKHVFIRHKDEIEQVGFTPSTFVDLVVNNFNRIYKGRENALQLVIWNGNAKVTIIEMNLALKKGFYEVKTATIKRKSHLENCVLLWKK